MGLGPHRITANQLLLVSNSVLPYLQGHLIGHIKDIGHDPANPITRLYATSAAQPYHNDSGARSCRRITE